MSHHLPHGVHHAVRHGGHHRWLHLLGVVLAVRSLSGHRGHGRQQSFRRPLLILALIAVAASALSLITPDTSAFPSRAPGNPPSPTSTAAPQAAAPPSTSPRPVLLRPRYEEDDPRFDCRIDGNGKCGDASP